MARRRRLNDEYFTPAHATLTLLQLVDIRGHVFECCSGLRHIARVLEPELRAAPGPRRVLTNDLALECQADYALDMRHAYNWRDIICERGPVDWVVSNPPFKYAPEIVPHGVRYARFGCAMLLRLTYLEPCDNRATWLDEHPPNDLIVLPRISFTGDGKTDNVTAAWHVWYGEMHPRYAHQRIIVVKKAA